MLLYYTLKHMKRQRIRQKKKSQRVHKGKALRDLLGIKFVTLDSKTSVHTLQTQAVAITWGYFSDFFHSAWTLKKRLYTTL